MPNSSSYIASKTFLVIMLCYLFIYCRRDDPANKVSHEKREKAESLTYIQNKNLIEVLSKIKNVSIEKLEKIIESSFPRCANELKITKLHESENEALYMVKILNSDLPNNLKNIYTVVDVKGKHTQYILPLEIDHIRNRDSSLEFGGIYSYREYEYYLIYKIQDNLIAKVLDSRDINKRSFVIGYYKDDECLDYIPDRLNLHYDRKNDEITFTGTISIYCNNGIDRYSNSVIIDTIEAKIIFKYDKSRWMFDDEQSRYYRW